MNLNPNIKIAYDLLHSGILAFSRAERQGIRVDIDYIEQQKQHLTQKIKLLEDKFYRSKFYQHWGHTTKNKPNINSNMQLGYFLYKEKGLKPVKLTVGEQGSTDEDALTQLNIPELNDILRIRKLKKIRDTYLEGFMREQVNGYIHPFFNLHLVRTYRSSSDHPNFQNIPIRDEEAMQACRKAIYPRPGHQLLEVDYSKLEVCISACYHNDPNMIKYINNPASDMHADMAKQIFMIDKFDESSVEHKILRGAAKNGFVFPEFYGDYYKNCGVNLACRWGGLPQSKWKNGQGIKISEEMHLSDHLISKGIKSFNGFTDHIEQIEYDFWENRFAGYQAWKNRWWGIYQKRGYIDTLTGFRCSGVMNKKEVTNYPISGSAFHCLLWSFIELDKIMIKEQWDTKLIGQIHDSIIFDVAPTELQHVVKVIKRVTCEDLRKAWSWISVPLSVDFEICPVDRSWAEKESISI